jgi:hypothetical protein
MTIIIFSTLLYYDHHDDGAAPVSFKKFKLRGSKESIILCFGNTSLSHNDSIIRNRQCRGSRYRGEKIFTPHNKPDFLFSIFKGTELTS